MSFTVTDQLDELRTIVFGAIDAWNSVHPQRLRSHEEHGSVRVTQVYGDATGIPSYTVTVNCALAGTGQLTLHGNDLAALLEHARLTLQHRMAAEMQHREERAHDDEFDRRFGVAV